MLETSTKILDSAVPRVSVVFAVSVMVIAPILIFSISLGGNFAYHI